LNKLEKAARVKCRHLAKRAKEFMLDCFDMLRATNIFIASLSRNEYVFNLESSFILIQRILFLKLLFE